MDPLKRITYCHCCGYKQLKLSRVLWPSLINEWKISDTEIDYINRQQGLHCIACDSNLRTMVLAKAIMTCYGFNGLLKEFVNKREAKKLKILEINPAGHLTQYLQKLPGHTLKMYPEIDMMNLPFGNDSFDLVIHSDTLEHIIDPVKGLSECNRVLDIGGYCIFTIPMIVDRLSVTREDAAPSYHGAKDQHSLDMIVYTEYGADAWKQVVNAGFSECRIYSLEYPSAHAFIGLKSKN